jgi:hypothetical protein
MDRPHLPGGTIRFIGPPTEPPAGPDESRRKPIPAPSPPGPATLSPAGGVAADLNG